MFREFDHRYTERLKPYQCTQLLLSDLKEGWDHPPASVTPSKHASFLLQSDNAFTNISTPTPRNFDNATPKPYIMLCRQCRSVFTLPLSTLKAPLRCEVRACLFSGTFRYHKYRVECSHSVSLIIYLFFSNKRFAGPLIRRGQIPDCLSFRFCGVEVPFVLRRAEARENITCMVRIR